MRRGENDTGTIPIPQEGGYQPPIARIGALLWTLAIALAVVLALVADPGQLGPNPVVFGRVFVGVIVFIVVFPLVFGLRRGLPSGE